MSKHTVQPITETLEKNYMPYAMSVIISRAIPEIDGLKPSHRKLLYTMYKMGLLTSGRTKSANVVGQTMKLNPHGDAAIYETLVRLTVGNSALLHPFIDSKGNFGKQYSRDMAYAASRYTEVKLSDICHEVFDDIDKNTVDFTDNYDGTMQEPLLLPVRFPSILTNSNQGIAVGMASNMCSFNLAEVCATAAKYIKNENINLTDTLLAPDFSTGAKLLYDKAAMEEIYRTGRGSFKLQATYSFDKKNNCIDITEIPYTTSIEAIIDKIADSMKQGKFKEISDVRDETDLNGLKITIDLKRGTDAERLMARLFKATPLQDSFGCNFNVLINGSPKVLGVRDILHEWTLFRISCVKRQIAFDIEKKSQRLHLLQGLEKILLDIDRAIAIIRKTERDADVVPNLMQGFDIDEVQAEFIAEIKLRNLNREYILKRTEDIESLLDDLALLNATLGDEGKVRSLIAKSLLEIAKKYGVPRKTVIISADETEIPEAIDEVEDYNLSLFLSREGYLKKIPLVSLRASNEHKLKENDEIIWQADISNRSEIIVFTNMAIAYKLKTFELADCKASQLGEYLPGLLQFSQGEELKGIVATRDFSGYVLFCYQNGKMAKIELSSYSTKLNRKKLANAFCASSPLVDLLYLEKDTDLAVFSNAGKLLVFSSASVNAKSTRSSQGVNVMTLRKKSVVSRICPLQDLSLADPNYYRTKNIPAVGCLFKQSDAQTTFDI